MGRSWECVDCGTPGIQLTGGKQQKRCDRCRASSGGNTPRKTSGRPWQCTDCGAIGVQEGRGGARKRCDRCRAGSGGQAPRKRDLNGGGRAWECQECGSRGVQMTGGRLRKRCDQCRAGSGGNAPRKRDLGRLWECADCDADGIQAGRGGLRKRCDHCRAGSGGQAPRKWAPQPIICRSCGATFEAVGNRVFCPAPECQQAAGQNRPALCAGGCGQLVHRGPNSLPSGQARCNACRAAARELAVRWTACVVCGDLYRDPPITRPRKTCSRRCSQLLRYGHVGIKTDKEALRASRRALDRARCAKRRTRLAVQVVEYVDPDVVFARDGWRCHICRQQVAVHLSGLATMGPTIDHLIPLAAGGEHSYANVALAHRRCNSIKGTGAANTQLALMG